ncbi:MAG: hypothetical protein LBG65_01970 [Puniceicoccales bacterium]|jgi:DNA polymerase|nr:hypothetical protein [Puniceicoccales bacterium]
MLRNVLEWLHESLADMRREGVSRLAIETSGLERLDAVVRTASGVGIQSTNNTTPSSLREIPPLGHGGAQGNHDADEMPASHATTPEMAPKRLFTPAAYRPSEKPETPAPEPSAPATGFSVAPLPEPPHIEIPAEIPATDKAARLAWLRERLLGCPVCNAHKHPGKQLVFGTGDPEAKIFFCGEAPGAEEESRGEPFVGPAGELLTKIISAAGLSREQVYIANILKWRPEMPTPFGNRPPTPTEIAYCLPYLRAQLAIIQPKAIVALGATAITGLLGPEKGKAVGRIRGHWQEFDGIPVMPTYHPAYLLRNNTNRTKRTAWEDMLLVMERVGMEISERQRGFFL